MFIGSTQHREIDMSKAYHKGYARQSWYDQSGKAKGQHYVHPFFQNNAVPVTSGAVPVRPTRSASSGKPRTIYAAERQPVPGGRTRVIPMIMQCPMTFIEALTFWANNGFNKEDFPSTFTSYSVK